jgi:hypothetical protein
MNVILYGGYLASDEEARFRYWAAEFKRIEADRAFGGARRAALLRRIGLLPGFVAGTSARAVAGDEAAETGLTEAGAVPIDSIVGAVEPRTGNRGEPRTRVLGRVPSLKRRWKEAWRRLWVEEDLDSLSALPVVRGADGWYLVDLPHSLLVLEILRAKGVREVRATTAFSAAAAAGAAAGDSAAAGTGATASCIEVERTRKRPTYRLVDCDRGYACCADEAGVAV